MKRWEITAMDGTKLTIDANNVDLTPSGVVVFVKISETLKNEKDEPIAEVCGLAGNTFKIIRVIPMPLVDTSKVISITSGSVDVSI